MKIVQARVIVPLIHSIFLGISAYVLEDLRFVAHLQFWLFWYKLIRSLTFISFLLYFWTSLTDPGFISRDKKKNEHDMHHKQALSMGSHLTGISAIKPVNPSTNTSALPHNVHIESFEGSHSGRIKLNQSSEESFGEQFYQLSDGDVPNLQPIEFTSKIIISKPIPLKPEPASPHIYSQEAVSEAAEAEPNKVEEIIPLFCMACNLEQPLRARHCQQCKECVAMFDHHCPFLGNCIGDRNRLLFFWFVFFQACECWIGFGICWMSVGPRDDWNSWAVKNMKYILLASLAFLLGVLISILWFCHFSLAVRNLTTYENLRWEKISYLANFKTSPFSKGAAENLAYYCSVHKELTEWKIEGN